MGKLNLQTRLQRVACLNENLYLTQLTRYSKITSEQLIAYASENSGIPKAQMAGAFYAINQQVEQFVLNGHSLEVGTLGTFYLGLKSKASETADGAGADAVKSIHLKFRQSKRIRELLQNDVSFNTMGLVSDLSDTDDEEDEDNSDGGNESNDGQDDSPL